MEAGRQYRIDMISREVDAFLRLEDPTGKEVAFDNGSGKVAAFGGRSRLWNAVRDLSPDPLHCQPKPAHVH